MNDDSECQTVSQNDNSERQTDECGSEHLKTMNDGFEFQTDLWLWMPN